MQRNVNSITWQLYEWVSLVMKKCKQNRYDLMKPVKDNGRIEDIIKIKMVGCNMAKYLKNKINGYKNV